MVLNDCGVRLCRMCIEHVRQHFISISGPPLTPATTIESVYRWLRPACAEASPWEGSSFPCMVLEPLGTYRPKTELQSSPRSYTSIEVK